MGASVTRRERISVVGAFGTVEDVLNLAETLKKHGAPPSVKVDIETYNGRNQLVVAWNDKAVKVSEEEQ